MRAAEPRRALRRGPPPEASAPPACEPCRTAARRPSASVPAGPASRSRFPAWCADCRTRAPPRSCCRAPCVSRSPPPGKTAASSIPYVSVGLLTSLLQISSQLPIPGIHYSEPPRGFLLHNWSLAAGKPVLFHHPLHHPEAAHLLLRAAEAGHAPELLQ